MYPENPDITIWLRKIREGDKDAENLVLEHLKNELYRLARRHLSGERKGHSLQATLLVDEAYMRLVRSGDRTWQNRNHFLALGAQAMRRFLVDHAREKLAAKRGGEMMRVEVNEGIASPSRSPEQFLDLHEALNRLAALDPRLGQIVEMHYFGGMTEEEIAIHFGIVARTVRREIRAAKDWFAEELGGKMSSS